MIFKCVYCGGRVVFDIRKQLMCCESCERLQDKPQMEETDFLFDRYYCPDCGAQLMTNEEEVTSQCPYCGALSVLYEGKNEEFKPEKILPFAVTRENAVEIIKREFAGYHFTPKGIRNFNIQYVRPIYIPFWITSVNIETQQCIRGEKTVNKQKIIYQYNRGITLDYDNMEINATKDMADRVALRLEPWHFVAERPFSPMYIAGFFAGMDDFNEETVEQMATARAKEFIDKKVMDSCTETRDNKVISCNYHCKINEKHLTLLPVWFFVASHKGKKFTAVVNGQTGKVVSAVPYYQSVFWAIVVFVTAISIAPMYWFVDFFVQAAINSEGRLFCVLIMFFGLVLTAGAKAHKRHAEYEKNLTAFQSGRMIRFVEKRRE